MSADQQLVLLYDGLCGFCDRVVQFVLSRDRRATIRFAPLQGEFARAVLARHPEVRNIDSLILVRGVGSAETVRAQSVAVADILHYLGGGWGMLATLLRVMPRFVSDAAYGAFAKIRYRAFGRYDSCPIPTPEQRARFIE